MPIQRNLLPASVLAVVTGLPATLAAQATPPPPLAGPAAPKAEDNPLGWTAKAALSYVGTGGNAQATSLGVKFGASHNWTRTYFTVLGGGVRADSTTIERFAVGPSESDFTTEEIEDREKTAENYLLDATLDRTVTTRV
jgi:hypothetical protein